MRVLIFTGGVIKKYERKGKTFVIGATTATGKNTLDFNQNTHFAEQM